MTSSPENKITRSDLVKSAVNVGALGMEFSWTYYKQMNIAFCLMVANMLKKICLLYTSPSPRDVEESRMPSSA